MKKEIDNIIRLRRAVYPKSYSDEKILKQTIIEILENANMAPTHKLTQPWIFRIFSNNQKLILGQELISKYRNHIKDEEKISDKKEKSILDKCMNSQYIIAICMRRDKNESIPEWEEIAATAMAVQNMWLSCTARNIGCYWSTPKFANKLHQFLGLDKNEKCLGFFYLGMFKHKKLDRTRRENIDKKIKWMD